MSMAFRTCPECRWNKVGHYCGKQMTLNGFKSTKNNTEICRVR